jgi:hypothetical protein
MRREILNFMDNSPLFAGKFSTRREMIEWFIDNLPREDSDWVDVCIWMAVRREIEAKRAEVPPELEEAVAGVLLAFWIDHPELGRP